MPSATIAVSQSTHDGAANWTQRSNTNGTVFNGTLVGPIIGPHFNTDLVYASFFILKLDNIPQGSTIDSCKLEIRTNNAYTGGLTNHIYVAVENNLDPTGVGAVSNGTLGSQPWQRLGRQAAATTLLGNRCGPTHNKAGQTLSSYGAHVRDPSALIYKAFCTDQPNAAALGRDLAGGSWVQTENFAPAVQKLVDDPGWNGTTQYVLVWLFSDIQTGTTLNIGNLASFAWDNGTVGASGYGNGGGQMHYYDAGPGTYPPRLLVDYTVTSLTSVNGGSQSSGNVRLSPALCLARMRGERAEITNYSGVIPVTSAGSHDLPLTGMTTSNPLDPTWAATSGNPTGTRLKWDTQRPGRSDGQSLHIEDYANNTPSIWWDIDKYQTDYLTRDVYSLRFYHRYERGAVINVNPPLIIFELNGTQVFRVEHKQYTVGSPDTAMNIRIAWSGGSTAWSTYEFNPPGGNGYYRYELQVDASQNPKVRLRAYLNDGTTALATLTASPTTVEMNRVKFADNENTAFYLFNQHIADFEVWSDYLLNREYPDSISNTTGTPYVPQEWAWYEYDGDGDYTELDDLGTVSSINPDGSSVVIDSGQALTIEDYTGEVWDGGTTPYTAHPALSYGSGTYRRLDLYVPNGTPPDGGWPVIVWTHGGFWVSGNRDSLPDHFITDCALRGYAIATCSYVLGGVYYSSLGQTYPAWDPNNPTGRYPSFILNYKEAAHWLQSNASTYDLNPDKFIATGHSAGGYNALGAAVSRGLTSDGGGRNLTLAGNSAFGCPNVPDPEFIGAYVWAGPVELNALKSWDPTHASYPYGGTGVGTIHATSRIFRGQTVDGGSGNVDNCNLDGFITLNAANVPSVCYAWGRADHLVVSAPFTVHSQQQKLADVFASVSGSLGPDITYEGHEVPDALHHTIHDQDLDYEHFFRWIGNLPGLNN